MIRNLLAACLIVLLSACAKITPIYNIELETIVTASGNAPTLDQARYTIRRAVIAKTWKVKDTGPNSIEANRYKGVKHAQVAIKFSPTEYSIHYKSSKQLLYDGFKIHRRYNSWVKGLRKKINLYFSQL